MGSKEEPIWRFEAVPGFFMQSEPTTNPDNFDNTKTNFGLIERTYSTDTPTDPGHSTQWQRFEKYVLHLVGEAPEDIKYKVIFSGRHGEGYHNLGEAKYGTKAWDDHWSKIDEDGELFFFDAHLTALGKEQALRNNSFFERQFKHSKMPAPEKYYVSPLYRCLQTASLTFAGLQLPAGREFKPTVKEMLREVMGEHTCDKRSSLSVIHNAFPDFEIEAGFTEDDELWKVDHRETLDEHAMRVQILLDDIFTHDKSTFLSFTSHSGAIAALLHVLGHKEFRLPTGGLIPVLVKATRRTA